MQNDAELWPNLGVVWRCRDQASWDLAKSFQDVLQDSFRLSFRRTFQKCLIKDATLKSSPAQKLQPKERTSCNPLKDNSGRPPCAGNGMGFSESTIKFSVSFETQQPQQQQKQQQQPLQDLAVGSTRSSRSREFSRQNAKSHGTGDHHFRGERRGWFQSGRFRLRGGLATHQETSVQTIWLRWRQEAEIGGSQCLEGQATDGQGERRGVRRRGWPRNRSQRRRLWLPVGQHFKATPESAAQEAIC